MPADRPDDARLLAAVGPALRRQRWFPLKDRPELLLTPVGRLPLPGGDGVQLAHLLVRAGDDGPLLQVPLSLRREPLPGVEVLARVDEAFVHDATHDPAWLAAFLAAGRATVRGPVGLTGRMLGPWPAPGSPGRVLTGEQSNTSMVVDGPDPAMLKLFRVPSPGLNPDVEVGAALTRVGSTDVPAVLGWWEGSWPAEDGPPASGHLAVLTRFVSGGRDAWSEAVRSARDGVPFTAQATQMGRTVRRVHQALASAFPVAECTADERDRLVDDLTSRVDWAAAQAPALATLAEPLRAHRQALALLAPDDLGPLQRVHGDLHLGQILGTTDGWAVLDFEGEPLRPLPERSRPDLPARDVAGMLRSFDYAAAVGAGPDPRWAADAGAAFADGYGPTTGASAATQRALLVDKALYEVVYETRNRPDWASLPLAAVRTLLRRADRA